MTLSLNFIWIGLCMPAPVGEARMEICIAEKNRKQFWKRHYWQYRDWSQYSLLFCFLFQTLRSTFPWSESELPAQKIKNRRSVCLFCEEGTFGAGKRLLLSWSAFSVQRFKVVSSLAFSSPFQFYGMLISRESSALVFKLMLAVEEVIRRGKGARTV